MSGDALALTHEQLSHFNESLPLRFPPSVSANDRLIVNIYGYFDESGTHKGSAALSVAGFLGKADEWGAFQVEWEDALRDFGLEFFHMASFESRQKGYDWPEAVRRERINRLLGIIDRHVLYSVGVVLPLGDYEAIFPEDEAPAGPNPEWLAPGIVAPGAPRPGDPPPHSEGHRPGDIRRKSGGPYGLAATILFTAVAEQVKPLRGDPFVAYIFESGAEGFGQIAKFFQDNYKDVSTRRELRLLSLAFEDKRLVKPLQAADLLAYELYKHLPRHLGQDDRPARYTLKALARLPRKWNTVDADELRKWHYVIGRGLHYSQGTWHK